MGFGIDMSIILGTQHWDILDDYTELERELLADRLAGYVGGTDGVGERLSLLSKLFGQADVGLEIYEYLYP